MIKSLGLRRNNIWVLSAAWAKQPIDCTSDAIINGCKGACCKLGSFWPAKAGETEFCYWLSENGCKFDIKNKPITCLLFPFKVKHYKGKSPSLHLYGRALLSCCKPNIKRDINLTIAETNKNNFIELFGENQYDKILYKMTIEKDIPLVVSDDILKAYEIERKLEQECKIPIPRTKIRKLIK